MNRKIILAFIVIQSACFCASEKSTDLAKVLFQKINGVPILLNDVRLEQMASAIDKNDWESAAHVASEDDRFFNVTVRDWASSMSNRKESSYVPVNDFIAFVVGLVRDEVDARELLTGNYRYEASKDLGLPVPTPKNGQHYDELEKRGLNLRKVLVKRTPQWDEISEAAGVLTSYGWASEHFFAGTNRRATEFSFQEFLCKPITQWKDAGLPDYRIRRDVPRDPSGSPQTFQNECRSCHAALDAMSGAFAHFDFNEKGILFGNNWIAPKMNQNNHVYPKGFEVKDAGWVNLATQHHNVELGWRGNLAGYGINDFGKMLSNSKAFSNCMATRAFKRVCRRENVETDDVIRLAEDFEKNNYNLRKLFETVAIGCTKGEL